MSADYKIIEGEYLRDIIAQPQAVRDTVNALEGGGPLRSVSERLAGGEFGRVVLTGMGSSFHALHPLNLELVNHGHTPLMVETSELIYYMPGLFDRNTLVVAASQSGRSVEIIRLLEINQRRAMIIGVTNTPGSPLAKEADAVLLTHAGDESSVSCKTYLASLAALAWLGSLLCRKDLSSTLGELKEAAPAIAQYLECWRNHVRAMIPLLDGVRSLFLAGRGASLAAVGTGGLIIKESTHFHSEGMSSAALRHGPMEMLSPDIFVLVFAGDTGVNHLNSRLVQDVRAKGGRAELVGKEASQAAFQLPSAPQSVRPVLEILPVEMITLTLAALTGREAGKFEIGSKVTTAE
jgi:glucosamine--fructose-6-phosphate aminotransferase (isomerizing)